MHRSKLTSASARLSYDDLGWKKGNVLDRLMIDEIEKILCSNSADFMSWCLDGG